MAMDRSSAAAVRRRKRALDEIGERGGARPLFMGAENLSATAHGSWELRTSAPTRNRVRLCYGERKGAGLTCGPGRSAAEEACAGVARGWRQRSWATRLGRGNQALAQSVKSAGRLWKKMDRGSSRPSGRKEEGREFHFFPITFQSKF